MMSNKEKLFLKKDIPLALCVSWIKESENKPGDRSISPDKTVLEESGSFQELLDLVDASPTTPISVKKLFYEYAEKRKEKEDIVFGLFMKIIEEKKD